MEETQQHVVWMYVSSIAVQSVSKTEQERINYQRIKLPD